MDEDEALLLSAPPASPNVTKFVPKAKTPSSSVISNSPSVAVVDSPPIPTSSLSPAASKQAAGPGAATVGRLAGAKRAASPGRIAPVPCANPLSATQSSPPHPVAAASGPVLRTKGGDGMAKLALLTCGATGVTVVNTGATFATTPKAAKLARVESVAEVAKLARVEGAAAQFSPGGGGSETPPPLRAQTCCPVSESAPRPTPTSPFISSSAPATKTPQPPVVPRTQPSIEAFFSKFKRPS